MNAAIETGKGTFDLGKKLHICRYNEFNNPVPGT